MKISILTLFPDMFQGPFSHSIVKIAQEKKLLEINLVNIRDFGIGTHKVVDDTPYGGGIGMVMRADVLHNALQHTIKSYFSNENQNIENSLKTENSKLKITQKIILLSASGTTYTQSKAKEYSQLDHLILICGHYEGVDERIKPFIDEEISLGDFVVTGGEIPAMLIADSVTRLISGVLKPGATDNESFSITDENKQPLLEHPQYTKPQEFEQMKVPEILLSGNHKKINLWRLEKSQEKTQQTRPDLLSSVIPAKAGI